MNDNQQGGLKEISINQLNANIIFIMAHCAVLMRNQAYLMSRQNGKTEEENIAQMTQQVKEEAAAIYNSLPGAR